MDRHMQRKLLVATHNAGKVGEFGEMLSALQVDFLSLDDVGIEMNIAETGNSFLTNAILKAETYADMSGLITLADDSGLEVDALDGAPGIYTARFGGPGLTPAQRYQHLLDQMKHVPPGKRSARFRCVIVVAAPNEGALAQAHGVCEGVIAEKPSGEGGFGYDPVFFLPEKGKTMSQLPADEKNKISHRGRALQAIKPALKRILKGQ